MLSGVHGHRAHPARHQPLRERDPHPGTRASRDRLGVGQPAGSRKQGFPGLHQARQAAVPDERGARLGLGCPVGAAGLLTTLEPVWKFKDERFCAVASRSSRYESWPPIRPRAARGRVRADASEPSTQRCTQPLSGAAGRQGPCAARDGVPPQPRSRGLRPCPSALYGRMRHRQAGVSSPANVSSPPPVPPAPRAVGNVRRCQVHHEQPSIRIHRDMPLAPDDFLGRVVATLVGRGRFDCLAVDDARTWARLPPSQRPIQHQHHVVPRAEQEAAHEPTKLPIHGLPRREVVRQHAPAATRPHQIAQGVHHLPQVALPSPATQGRAWQQRLHSGLFDVRHVAGVTLGLASQLRLAFSMFFFSHPAFTSHSRGIFKRALT